uniref:Endonuclease/exonuclease/phosphatase family domain-containing protein 1 n=1 Tax=Tetraodon nigroviridis TaxID=99883 RepID=H3DLD6_TETNG
WAASSGCHRAIPADPADLGRGRKFSAACSFGPILVNQERLNINAATEEELMTLPGVGRAVAQNIVEYRDRIGGFRKVEDLALVSGVGATKLEAVKPEICVSSRTSSSQHSPASLRRDPDLHPCTGVNINTATPAQLMSIRGITEKVAASIVAFRAHGPFRSVEDLVRVSHVNSSLLDRIRFQVFVERPRAPSTNGWSHPSPASFSPTSDDPDPPPWGPTRLVSARPSVEPPAGLRDGRPVVRVGTWSLQGCSCDKANNPGVKEVVCMTLLENSIKLLAVQDLLEREALDKFCAELNRTLASLRRWALPRGLWTCVVSEEPTGPPSRGRSYSGFLWDSLSGVDLKDAAVLEPPVANGNGSAAPPRLYLAHFSIGSLELAVVNVHAQEPASGAERHALSRSLQEALRGEEELVVLGDFGGPRGSELDVLRKEKFCPLLPPTRFTDISTRSPQGSRCLDNIWLSRSLRKLFSGHCLVVREGLTHPWIPDNWSWGGVASDHCPVVAEIYAGRAVQGASGSGVAVVDRGDRTPKHER